MKRSLLFALVVLAVVLAAGCAPQAPEQYSAPALSELAGSWSLVALDSTYYEDSNGDRVPEINTTSSRVLKTTDELVTFTTESWTQRIYDRAGSATCVAVVTGGMGAYDESTGEYVAYTLGLAQSGLKKQVAVLKSGSRIRIRHFEETIHNTSTNADSLLTRMTRIGFYDKYTGPAAPSGWPAQECN